MNPKTSLRQLLNWLQERWMLLLQLTVSLTLLARGYLTWRWDSPLRSLIWQEDWWSGPLQSIFGISWREFAEQSDPYISLTLKSLGLGLMICAALPWVVRRKHGAWTRWLLYPATLILVLDAWGRWVTVDGELGMAIEHALQVVTPLVLLLALRQTPGAAWRLTVMIAASMTFVGHGLYALGFHAVPLIFKTMTMKILGCDEETALHFLQVAGWLDFIAVVLIWIPRLRIWGLGYMILWGGATALARIWAHFGLAQLRWGLDPWLAETLVRSAHWLLPLLLLLSFRSLPWKKESA